MSQTEPEQQGQGRGQWSRMGFILAASGSAIGLGNVVFFSANAYRFGGGAFYLPYLLALMVIGIPLMILELGLGHQERRAFPQALQRVAGNKGELLGWWALANTGLIALYYVAILGWVVGMFFGSMGALWESTFPTPGFAADELPNPYGYFFHLLSSWKPVLFVGLVWLANGWIVRRGTRSIERAVRVFVPLMWVLMLVLVVRGLTLAGGPQGVWYLFTPDLRLMREVSVWQGAFSQIFFTLSLGFGVMTAYASYLPPKSDQTNNAVVISCLNCGFEYIAGVAVFAILFVFAAVPQASTISMMFFIVPQGIAQLPGGGPVVIGFGLLFFLLLLLAGLSSTVSLVESLASALIDKFRFSRRRVVVGICGFGAAGSCLFALPHVVDPAIVNDGTLGLTLLDLVDHWAFNYGLLVVGLSECLLIGWVFGVDRIRRRINSSSVWRLGRWYNWQIRWLIPGAILVVLASSAWQELSAGLYGSSYAANFAAAWRWLAASPKFVLLFWLIVPLLVAWLLTKRRVSNRRAAAIGKEDEKGDSNDRALQTGRAGGPPAPVGGSTGVEPDRRLA
ncbi:MAG: sodium-dependent transporter [Acidobacteria bacterium]|nr:MAG: sodium-dependent transporter [Acidobacteriota bacterium]